MSRSSPWTNGSSGSIASITGGSISGVTGARMVIQQGGIPLIGPGSFTMNNNGAFVLGTALNATYPNAYMYFKSGDIAAGVPASDGWYYVTMTTTTAGTAFNNTYTSGIPTIPGSPTAFATTGPGARTGDTGAEVAHTVTVPVLSSNSQVFASVAIANTNNANAKTYTVKLGGTAFHAATAASVGRAAGIFIISNTATNKQQSSYGPTVGFAPSTQEATGAVDTTSTSSFTLTIQRATATDNIVVFPLLLEAAL